MSNSSPPRVALIDETNGLEYAKVEEVSYNLYDILWSDGKATQEVRPVSDGVIPIGLCVIPTNWLDGGEKARFCALKYMSSKTPEIGGLVDEQMYWGAGYGDEESPIPFDNPEDDPLKKYYVPYACKDERGKGDIPNNISYNEAIYYYTSQGVSNIKDLRNRENWLYTLNYCKENPGKYAIGDIDGKQNTINISVEGNYYETGSYPDMKYSIAKYAPVGTQAGDWFVPALGELMQFTFRLKKDQNSPSINDKLANISKIYPNDCVTLFNEAAFYWSSNVHNSWYSYKCDVHNYDVRISIYNTRNNYAWSTIAFLQR